MDQPKDHDISNFAYDHSKLQQSKLETHLKAFDKALDEQFYKIFTDPATAACM